MKISQVIKSIQDDPDEILGSLEKDSLKKLIDYLLDKYHNENKSLVSDQLFDYIKEYYEKNYEKVTSVGSPIKSNGSTKVKLPYYMGSLDKIKPSTGTFNKWVGEFTGPYVLSYKLDGISALLYKKNGKVSMYTRGDGIEGIDITHCIDPIGINTVKLNEGDAIRGELIMSKENFKKISDKMANPRNAVSGIINTKKPDIEMLKLIDFVAYWVLYPEFISSEQLKYIEKKEFTPRTVPYFIKKAIQIDMLSEMLVTNRKDYKYEIDGIVVIDNSKYYPQDIGENPSWGFAFKQLLTDQIAESTVVDVIWEVSKDKYIKPKIKINTVELGGVEITYATAFNAKFIVDHVIGPGAIVQIVRSGDVIPKIEKVLAPADSKKPKMPSIKYEWNETSVDLIAIDLDEETMEKIIVKKLTYFFVTLDIRFMGEGTVEKFVSNGYDDLYKILKADKTALYKIEGLGTKSIDKIYESIDSGLTGRNIYEIMAASQVFGRGIGTRKFKAIINDYPNIVDIYKKEGKEFTTKLINTVNGFEAKTTGKIVDNFDEFIVFLNELVKIKPNLLKEPESTKKSSIKPSNKPDVESESESESESEAKSESNKLEQFANKTIVFTGFRDKDIEKQLEDIGVKLTSSVSKNTDLVVAADPNEESNKITKAKQLKITILSKEQFYDKIK